MSRPSAVICPRCQSPECRDSRWLSATEKNNHPESAPYRCLKCSHRFIAAKPAPAAKNPATAYAPAAFVAVVVFAALLWLLPDSSESPLDGSPTVASLDPEVRKSAEAGDPEAQFRLGEALLLDPAHTPENSKDAVRWLKTAAENGHTEAMIYLGRLSRTGVGVLQDFDLSAKWIRTAARRGHPEGMLELGRLYRDGIGVDKDLILAYAWFNRASAARNIDAVREREAIARVLTVDELRKAQNLSATDHASGEKETVKTSTAH